MYMCNYDRPSPKFSHGVGVVSLVTDRSTMFATLH